MKKRFSTSIKTALVDFERQTLATETPPKELFQDYGFELQTGKDFESEFEIMYLPKCRVTPTLTTFEVPAEHIRLRYDLWAKPSVTRLSLVKSVGKVTAQTATGVTVDMNWQPPFGAYLNPEGDLRKQLGKSFSVALPPCAG